MRLQTIYKTHNTSVLHKSPLQKKAVGGIPTQEILFLYKTRKVGDEVEHVILGKGKVTDPIPYPGTSFRRVRFANKRELCVFENMLR